MFCINDATECELLVCSPSDSSMFIAHLYYYSVEHFEEKNSKFKSKIVFPKCLFVIILAIES